MSLIKRLSVSLRAGLDRAVGEIEDHDAVVEAALEELRGSIATLRVEKARVERQGTRTDQDIEQAEHQANRWRERARGETDQARALECLRRHRSERQRIDQLNEQQRRITQALHRIDSALSELERRMQEREEQRDSLRVRGSQGDARTALTRLDGELGIDLDRALRRWEVDVTRTELRNGGAQPEPDSVASGDVFADEFERDESEAALRAELNALKEEAK